MPRKTGTAIAFILTASCVAIPGPAGAVVMGTTSSLSAYTVRLVGNGYCTGVAIARHVVVTAAHCARGMRVVTGGGSYRIAGITHSAVLDDGRRVSVAGDAAILRLAEPLPYGAAPVGEGQGSTFTIAGYGTTDERAGASFGALHEATLVAAGPRALVDPDRRGPIGASACFGDSGGPVMRGGVLVGVITRAAHASPRIACGHLTRWTPIRVSGAATSVASYTRDAVELAPRRHKKKRVTHTRREPAAEASSVNLFAAWFTEKAETRRSMRRKRAQR